MSVRHLCCFTEPLFVTSGQPAAAAVDPAARPRACEGNRSPTRPTLTCCALFPGCSQANQQRRRLTQLLSHVLLRRTKGLIKDQLPKKTDNVVSHSSQPVSSVHEYKQMPSGWLHTSDVHPLSAHIICRPIILSSRGSQLSNAFTHLNQSSAHCRSTPFVKRTLKPELLLSLQLSPSPAPQLCPPHPHVPGVPCHLQALCSPPSFFLRCLSSAPPFLLLSLSGSQPAPLLWYNQVFCKLSAVQVRCYKRTLASWDVQVLMNQW